MNRVGSEANLAAKREVFDEAEVRSVGGLLERSTSSELPPSVTRNASRLGKSPLDEPPMRKRLNNNEQLKSIPEGPPPRRKQRAKDN